MAAIGSFIVPLVFGIAFANFIIGLPVALATADMNTPVLLDPAAKALFVLTPAPYFWQLFSRSASWAASCWSWRSSSTGRST